MSFLIQSLKNLTDNIIEPESRASIGKPLDEVNNLDVVTFTVVAMPMVQLLAKAKSTNNEILQYLNSDSCELRA